jgi:hypothetical protein
MIEEMMRRELVRYLIQKTIFCPFTGAVLDMDTCTVILDSDGDPAIVCSPEAGRLIKEKIDEGITVFTNEGYTLDESTLR